MEIPPTHLQSFWGRIAREVDPPAVPLDLPTVDQIERAVERLDAHLLFKWHRFARPPQTPDQLGIMRLIVRGMATCRKADR